MRGRDLMYSGLGNGGILVFESIWGMAEGKILRSQGPILGIKIGFELIWVLIALG